MTRTHLGVALLLAAIGLGAAACDEHNKSGVVSADRTGTLGEPVPRGRPDQAMLDRCGPGATTDAGDTEILRHPYLQATGPTSTSLVWTARSGAEGVRVLVTRPDGEGVISAAVEADASARPKNATQLVARLEGLEPSTLYCWSISRGETVLVEPTGFRTAPPVGSTDDVSFLVF